MPKYTDAREATAQWLTANDINPTDVPIDADLTTATHDGARVIHYEAVVRDANGLKLTDDRQKNVLTERRTAPLVVEPPATWRPHEKPTRDQLTAERDGAYRERAELLAWLAALLPEGDAVLTPAPDVDEDGWMLLFLHVRGQQLTWHISPRDVANCMHHLPVDRPDDDRAQWDGHTTEDKYARIAYFVADLWTHCGRECREGHSYRGRCEAKIRR